MINNTVSQRVFDGVVVSCVPPDIIRPSATCQQWSVCFPITHICWRSEH